MENSVKAHTNTVVRIASISKPITCAIAAKLYEENKLDFDRDIDAYLPSLPDLNFENKKFKITTRQLVSHISGIRHYEKKSNDAKDEKKSDSSGSDTELAEFYIKDNFKNTTEALNIFINDELLSQPG